MRIVFLCLALFAIVGAQLARAADLEQFFMPGELFHGHQDFTSECTACHVRLRDTTQNQLCLDCHDHQPVADDIRSGQGYHGKDKNARTQPCKTCHSEHKGPQGRIVWLDRDKFDHRLTDYELTGRHWLADCAGCHLNGKKYREATQTCFDCHGEDDAHEGSLGEQCDSCHDPVGWGRFDFDHDKTDFKLRFAHQRVNCNACHIGNKYRDTPKQCVSCHEIRDVHSGRFGSKCESCHQEKRWDQDIFDHDRDTDYRLLDGHRNVACHDCHAPDYRVSDRKNEIRDCYSCHRSDDAHQGLNGEQCKNCHSERGWPHAEFDHGANTEFALHGAHNDLACDACHALGAETKKIDTACYSCHRQDDAHQRAQGEACDRCHHEVAWLDRVRFDHDLSSFPLIGQHAAAGCEACHQSSVFSNAGKLCSDCHWADDVHDKALGQDCARCHNSNGWMIWSFDHDQTDFGLRHAHAELHCHRCHDRPPEKMERSAWRCADCHRRDDVHDGNFGIDCGRCHNLESFDEVDIDSLRAPGGKKKGDRKP